MIGWSLTRGSVATPYGAGVFALTLDQATTIAGITAVVLVVLGVLAFWVMKTVVQKLVVATLLGLLAFAVWSQRTALQDCADKVQANFEQAGTAVTFLDTECSFFGVNVTIADPRSERPSRD